MNNGDLTNYSKFTDNELEELISNHTIIDASGISSNKKNFHLRRFIESNASWPYRLAKLSIKSKKDIFGFLQFIVKNMIIAFK